MRLKSKFLVLLLAVVFAFTMFAMAACGDDDESETVSITLSETEITLVEGGNNATVNATVKGTKDAVKWTVDNSAVVTIQYEGKTCLIKPISEGDAVVTAKVGDKTATCNVKVNPAPKPAVTITLGETALNLTRGDQATEVTAILENAEDGDTVEWSLANGGDAVVTITPDGNKVSVLPIAVGTTTLTATFGDVTETVDITVVKRPVTLTLDKESVRLDMGDGEEAAEVKLTETVTATATDNDEKVQWKVGSAKIATIEVSENGNVCTVTAVAVGTTTLTATVEGVTKTIGVEVDGTAGAIEIELSEEEDFEMTTGATKAISATVVGSLDAPVWTVDDEEVIEIEGEGNEITVKALKEGTATLTVTVGGETKTLTVDVWDAASATLDKTEITLFNDENDDEYSETVTATVTGKIKTVSWEITEGDEYIEIGGENTNTLTVTAKAAGTATIVAKLGEEVYATLTVTVKAPVTITVSRDRLIFKEGGNTELVLVTVTDTDEEIELRISDDEVVTVTKSYVNGHYELSITPGTVGQSTIYVDVGGKWAAIYVAVESIPVLAFNSTTTFGEAGGSIWHQGFFTANETVTSGSDMEVVVKVNGSVVAPIETKILNDQVQVHIQGSKYDDVEIGFTFKNDGETVATAKLTYKGVKEAVISDETKSISKGQKDTVSVISVNGSENLTGKTIVWTIEDVEGDGVAAIPANSTGASVEITAVAAGRATLTCTIGEGEDAIVKTCAITVVEGTVVEEKPEDVSDKLVEQEVYGQWNICIRLDCDAELGGKIANVEVTATVNGENTNVVIHEVYGGGPKYVKMGVSQDWTNSYVFTLNYKNAAGKVIATGTFNKQPAKSLKLDKTNVNLTLAEGQIVTETVTATVSSTVVGDISWTVDDESIATVAVSDDKMSVTVTAVAKGTATITATVDGLEKTCTVNVLEDGDDPIVATGEQLDATYQRKYGDNYIVVTLSKALTMGADFDEYRVNGEKFDAQHYVADPAPTYQFFVGGANYASGSKVKIEFYQGGSVVYWFECEVG